MKPILVRTTRRFRLSLASWSSSSRDASPFAAAAGIEVSATQLVRDVLDQRADV